MVRPGAHVTPPTLAIPDEVLHDYRAPLVAALRGLGVERWHSGQTVTVIHITAVASILDSMLLDPRTQEAGRDQARHGA